MGEHKAPEHVDKLLHKKTKERKSKGEPVAKPNGIERKGNKYKVFLEYEGKRIHIGYYKTLEAAEEALEKAKRDGGLDG